VNRALVAVVIRMMVTPIPVGVLLFHFEFEEWVVLPVVLAEVHAVGTIFVVVPIVVILVIAVVDALVVIPVFLLMAVVLPRGRAGYGRGDREGRGKTKGTKQISISIVPIDFLLGQRFLRGTSNLQGVCGFRFSGNVRKPTARFPAWRLFCTGQSPASNRSRKSQADCLAHEARGRAAFIW